MEIPPYTHLPKHSLSRLRPQKLALEQVNAGGQVTWPLFYQFGLLGEWLNLPHHNKELKDIRIDPDILHQTNDRGEVTFLGSVVNEVRDLSLWFHHIPHGVTCPKTLRFNAPNLITSGNIALKAARQVEIPALRQCEGIQAPHATVITYRRDLHIIPGIFHMVEAQSAPDFYLPKYAGNANQKPGNAFHKEAKRRWIVRERIRAAAANANRQTPDLEI